MRKIGNWKYRDYRIIKFPNYLFLVLLHSIAECFFCGVKTMDIYTEDLPFCPTEEYLGGVATRIWYAPADFFGRILVPEHSAFRDRVVIPSIGISLKWRKSLNFIDVFFGEGAINTRLIGSTGVKRQVTDLELSIAISNPINLGFVDVVKNIPIIFLVPDSNGNIWLIGTLKNPARMNNADGSSGKKIEDGALLHLSFTANTQVYQYLGKIEQIRSIGGFTQGFTDGYKK